MHRRLACCVIAALMLACGDIREPSTAGISDFLAGRECNWMQEGDRTRRICKMHDEIGAESWCCVNEEGDALVCGDSYARIYWECQPVNR
jgi:hypothetical protein